MANEAEQLAARRTEAIAIRAITDPMERAKREVLINEFGASDFKSSVEIILDSLKEKSTQDAAKTLKDWNNLEAKVRTATAMILQREEEIKADKAKTPPVVTPVFRPTEHAERQVEIVNWVAERAGVTPPPAPVQGGSIDEDMIVRQAAAGRALPAAPAPTALTQDQKDALIARIKEAAKAENNANEKVNGKQLQSVDMATPRTTGKQADGRAAAMEYLQDFFREKGIGLALSQQEKEAIGFDSNNPRSFILEPAKAKAATELYQDKMGLKKDGLIGDSTIAAMQHDDKPVVRARAAAPARQAGRTPAPAAAPQAPQPAAPAAPAPAQDALDPKYLATLDPEVREQFVRDALKKAGVREGNILYSPEYFFQAGRQPNPTGKLTEKDLAELSGILKGKNITLEANGNEVQTAKEAVAVQKAQRARGNDGLLDGRGNG